MKTFVIIPSGGEGKRIGGSIPKQYRKIGDKEMIVYTIETFQNCPETDEIIIAAQEDYFGLLSDLVIKYNLTKVTRIVKGGKERQHSVFNALKSIDCSNDDLIAVHDAARPLLPAEVLKNAINSAIIYDNITVGLKVKDTLIKAGEFINEYLNRDEIYYVQTPQIFKVGILKDAFAKAESENFLGTDESMLVTRASYTVKIVEGSSLNFKITTESDLELFEKIVKNNS